MQCNSLYGSALNCNKNNAAPELGSENITRVARIPAYDDWVASFPCGRRSSTSGIEEEVRTTSCHRKGLHPDSLPLALMPHKG